MIAPLAKLIDWSALQLIWTMRLNSVPTWNLDATKLKLEEALQFLNGSDFIPATSDPAQIEFDGPLRFKFPTPRPCDMEENNIVYGRLYRCGGRWQERPVIILLHGGGDLLNHRFRFPWIVPACNRAGFNVATVVASYHFQRRARRRVEWSYLRTAHAFAQNVAEIRALTGWLLAEGCPSVALWGVSLGGWLAGLTACHDARIASVVLTVSGVRMKRSSPVVWRRVPTVKDFLSYCRLVKGTVASAGKIKGLRGAKLGNPYLRWAFGQAAVIAKRDPFVIGPFAQRLEARLNNKFKANTVLAIKLARAVYFMLKQKTVFDPDRLVAALSRN